MEQSKIADTLHRGGCNLTVEEKLPSAAHPAGGLALRVCNVPFFVSNGRDGVVGGTGVSVVGATGATGQTGSVAGASSAAASGLGSPLFTIGTTETLVLPFSNPPAVSPGLPATLSGGTYTAGSSGLYYYLVTLVMTQNTVPATVTSSFSAHLLVNNIYPAGTPTVAATLPVTINTTASEGTTTLGGIVRLNAGDTVSVSLTTSGNPSTLHYGSSQFNIFQIA